MNCVRHPEWWGHLAERYAKPAPRKMLALDGGGIRGVITLGFLARLEALLRQARHADETFRLCDYFDYIAGTSTGAIIATCLARGMSVAEIQQFYADAGPKMFASSNLLERLNSLYKSGPLQAMLESMFGDENLMPEHLRCLLLVVTRNMTTDSPWPLSSNPEAIYNNPTRSDCNLRIPLWQLVRASTAAPVYFPPENVQLDAQHSYTFVDGGITPYNNPAFLLYRMATHPSYQLCWPQGEKLLQIVSIGTGAADNPTFKRNFNIPEDLVGLPGTLMYGVQVEQDINCRQIGRCTYGATIDRELRDLTCRDITEPCSGQDWQGAPHLPLAKDLGRAFLYTRYNADLSQEGLSAMQLSDIDPHKVQKMDAVDQISNLIRIGQTNAEAQVNLAHFGNFPAQ
jgi:hypothetical protein